VLENIDIKEINAIAKEAGKAILAVYKKDFDVNYKEDSSPLTKADLKANEIICSNLQKLYPNIPIISEENKKTSYEERKNWEYLWLVDPLDGTKEFVKKNGEFTVNIALIHKDTPVLGVVYAPVLDLIYYAKKGEGAYKNSQKLPLCQERKTYKIVTSKSHLNKETKEFVDSVKTDKPKESVSIGSSLKLCLIAEGSADIYPRLGSTMEWDTAAAHAIALESGKKVLRFEDKKPVVYNKENLLNPWFIAY